MLRNHDKEKRPLFYLNLILLFLLFAIGIIIAAYLYYINYEKQYRTEVEKQLNAIADLKTGEIVQWRKERLGDGNIFFRNEILTGHVKRYLKDHTDKDAEKRIKTWIQQVQTSYNYNRIFLLDTKLTKRIITPEIIDDNVPVIPPNFIDSLNSGKIVFEDFYHNEELLKIFLRIFVPIIDGNNSNQFIGIIELRIDPEDYFYPLINQWPTPSKTSETIIARREGNDAVYLNKLKFKENTDLNFRISLERKEILTVKAVLGETGIKEGVDYRDIEGIADIRPIPNSTWYMITKMDKAEIYAPMKEKLWMLVGLVCAFLFSFGTGIGLLWRRQKVKFYKEKAVAAETLIIANKELAFQNTEKEKQVAANKELEAFSYSVSHDLRGPLRHIGGFVDLLIKNNSSQLDESGLRYLNIISNSSHEMGNLIDALLTFSRLSRAELQKTKINSRNLVNRVIKTFSDELADRKVEIRISELPDAMGDEELIYQVWVNLISNALKYSRNKEMTVIDIGGKTENGKTTFYIKDNGVGFDMKYADKLFGVFQRLHKTRDFEGVGIGLANVNRIVARHGGECWAESEVGKGATFFFSKPNN